MSGLPAPGGVPPRIAHVLAWSTVAGTEMSTLRIVQGLNGREYSHVAFCTTEAETVRAFFHGAGVATATYRPVALSYRRPGPFLKGSFELARELRRQRVALVHCSDLMAALGVAPAAKLARLPVLCHVRNPAPDIPRHDKPVLFAVDRFIFVSRHAQESFGYRVPASRASIVYDGVSSLPLDRHAARQGLLHELNLAPDTKLVGMVARFAPQKDHVTFIKAAAQVVGMHPHVRFLLVGDHTTTEAFRQHHRMLARLIESLGLTPYVIFTGFREDIPHLLAGLDVSVLCTHFEGFGLVIIEAMAQGTPVVATDVPGVTEIISDPDTGLLHRAGDEGDLASKLRLLLSGETLAERLGRGGLRLVKDRFSARRFEAEISEIYRHMLELRSQSKV